MLPCSPHLQPGLHHHQHLPCPSAQRLAVVAAAKKQQAPRRRVPKGGRQQQRQRFFGACACARVCVSACVYHSVCA